jgi:hypothetical protein
MRGLAVKFTRRHLFSRRPQSHKGGMGSPHRLRNSGAAELSRPPLKLDPRLIPVVLGFEGVGGGQAEILGLRRAECRQFDPELVEVEFGDLLVEVLWQHVDLVLVRTVVGPQLDLGQHLVGIVRLTYRDRRSPKQDARSHCCQRIPPFARRFGSEDP